MNHCAIELCDVVPFIFFYFPYIPSLSVWDTKERERGNKRQKDGAGPGRYTAGEETEQRVVALYSFNKRDEDKEKGEMEQNRRT